MRAGAFIENNLGALGRVAETGWFDSFLQPVGRAFPMVATADIGVEVGRLLIADWSGRKIVELGLHITLDDLSRDMGEALGRRVRARPIPRDQWLPALKAMGLLDGKTGPWEEMQASSNSGWIDFGVTGTELVAGKTTPAQVFARANKARADR